MMPPPLDLNYTLALREAEKSRELYHRWRRIAFFFIGMTIGFLFNILF